mmetsp:Transcript_30460/g.78924  ORF Transcript_30460/g.78924 Transcript_30460/m.78924 type:complete len:325 (-) Transcript_30460:380-1354(-)
MSANDAQKACIIKKSGHGVVAIKVRAPPHFVRLKLLAHKVLLVAEGVSPNQVTHRAGEGGLSEAVDLFDVTQRGDGRRDATVDAQELVANIDAKGHAVKRLHHLVVKVFAVLVCALIFEVEVAGHSSALVVATNDDTPIRAVDLQREEVEAHLHGEATAVDKIAQKYIGGRLWRAADVKQLDQIEKLAVHITAHCDGWLHVDDVRLRFEALAHVLNDAHSCLFFESTFQCEVNEKLLRVGHFTSIRKCFVCGLVIERGRNGRHARHDPLRGACNSQLCHFLCKLQRPLLVDLEALRGLFELRLAPSQWHFFLTHFGHDDVVMTM